MTKLIELQLPGTGQFHSSTVLARHDKHPDRLLAYGAITQKNQPMRYALFLIMALSASPAMTATLHVYGPGGPAPAMKEAAQAFSEAHKIKVEVTAGPTPEWKALASKNADVIFSGSESMMTDFLTTIPNLDPTSVKALYLRPSAILVRPGNPKRIKGIQDLLTPGRRILVVQGSGQGGLWEDVAGRLGDIRSVRAMRANIVEFAGNSGEAKQTWQADPSIDAWLIWNIWQVANPTLADVVEIEPEYRIHRDTGVASTRRGQRNPHAQAFIDFLASSKGAAIFAKWGWMTTAPTGP